jgi:hypothetical protein
MRFHTTSGFQEALRAERHAMAFFEVGFDIDDNAPETVAASKAEYAALEAVLTYPAITPAEVWIKLDHIFKREVMMWDIKDHVIDALEADLKRLVRQPVSGPVNLALANWRAAYVANSLHPGDDEEDNRLCEVCGQAYRDLLAVPCTTPGDVMLKAFANMLETVGHTLIGEARADLTGNLYDVNVSALTSPRDQEEVWHRALYTDLDGCDMGMNLLAYGSPVFSAGLWMERADACGLQVNVMALNDRPGGNLYIAMAAEDDLDPRVARERDRLHRILAIDGARYGAVAREIREEWPQLVLRPAIDPQPMAHEKAA